MFIPLQICPKAGQYVQKTAIPSELPENSSQTNVSKRRTARSRILTNSQSRVVGQTLAGCSRNAGRARLRHPPTT